MKFQAIEFRSEGSLAFLRFARPEANNTINRQMVDECLWVLEQCQAHSTVLVLEGGPEVFCFGADFQGMHDDAVRGVSESHQPERLYEIWQRMVTGSFITISHVRGKVNAGGMGFVAASDIVLSHTDAQFSLSELIFDVMPACVLPFLIRRVGFQRAHYLTLSTLPVGAVQASQWGLVDDAANDSNELLRRHLLRLRRLSKQGVGQYKDYMNTLATLPFDARQMAIEQNHKVFSNPRTRDNIHRYVSHGLFPWERD
ncbi:MULTISPECIES: enoyl-CoA hydratase/isomerase [Pseudomonas fluorescens group]|uniref:Enoyl-CoA hydratase/isomerase n=1 Tax=Pseudomonas fluorescens TaxID=294 RepID=A0AAE2Q2I5_PSEFL|nr:MULTISPECIES: enoyl-CoA hydratase/isomerase [Pseudomonas fluorescens group]MBA1429394.1 enoyl-CoA hydratase/isomerase [Pseudomonas orientalis]MBD8273025.1 enoyl-CoA hydratase/isomerase [Pseudomonas fluorescens]